MVERQAKRRPRRAASAVAEALRESEERFRALAENSPDVIMRFDRDCRHLYANAAVEAQTGIPAAAFAGRTHRELGFPEALCEVWEAAIGRVFASGEPHRIEFELPRHIWIDWFLVPERRPDGGVVAVMTVARDITDRKHAEEALERRVAERTAELEAANLRLMREADERRLAEAALTLFRALIDHSNDAIEVVDPETGRFLDVNEMACQAHGYTREEYLALTVPEVETASARRDWKRVMRELRRAGSRISEGEHRRKDGSLFPVEVNASYVRLDRDYVLAVVRDISERRRTEQAMRETDERYRSLFDNMLEGFAYCRMLFEDGSARDFVYLQVNPAFEVLTGLRDVVGKKVSDVLPGIRESNPEVFEIYGRVARTGRPERFETFVPQLGIWLSIAVFCPEPECFVAVFDNVSEGKRAEHALRQSEERYRSILQEMIEGYYEVDLNGNMTFCNDAVTVMLGYSRDELIGLNNRSYMNEATARSVFQAYNRVFRTAEATKAVDWELIRKNGTRLVVETSIALIRDGEGAPVGFRGVIHDVTERKRAEGALRGSEERYRLLYRDAPIGVFHYDTELRITDCNDRFVAILESSRERLLGLDMRALHDTRVIPAIGQAVAGEYGRYVGPYSATTSSAQVFVSMRTAPLRSERGEIVGGIGIVEDMTERRRLEEQLLQSQKMEAVGTLAGGVAHDFNNLLQAMLSHAQLLHGQAGEPGKVQAVAHELEQQILRGASLTRQLLLFSRRETVKPERLDLNETVREATRILQRLVPAHIALVAEPTPDRLSVDADRGQLQQVLMNLTLNAADAMPDGGRLVIRTGALGEGEVWLSVEDTGVGIPDAIRDRIFEPFFTTKEPGKGTGLGLSVVHGIITRHGGRIEVESRVSEGSTFRVVLPRAASGDSPAVERTAEPASGGRPGRSERVLLVEDDQAAREGLLDILLSLGYGVVATGSGEEAARLPAEEPFDLLLTDLMLPGMLGPRLADDLKRRWPGLKVILMSGYAEDEAVRRGVTAGTVRFLQKPFSMDALARELRAALDE